MLIDILFALLMALAVYKGFQRGLILGVFSLLAVIIGLAAAMKLSVIVAGYIGKSVSMSDGWLPVISFAVVFLLAILLIRLGAKIIEKTVELAMLGWLNKLFGILLFIIIFTTVFSVFLFYAEQIKLIRQSAIDQSLTYYYIQPWGPKAINSLGAVIPLFRDMFEDLKNFFGGVAGKF